jgi:carbonic anhydrase/acetyltransferase-like protein (isoleucine patch superfamily)
VLPRFDTKQPAVGTKTYAAETALIIRDAAGIGMGTILSAWSEVARGSIVAEGAVVKREQKIPEAIIVAGNPAKKIRAVSQQERDFRD